jgi:cytochrome c oxidase accessory protein FixG
MPKEVETFRDHISTVDEKGKRVWIFPKKPSGWFYSKRKLVSYVFLAILFIAPHIYIFDEPLLMFNIIERKFIIFGKIFWPQDMYLFALALILGVIFVIFFTIIFGRLFCGWICPQTIFMEMVFRRIEYLIDGDWTEQKKLKNSKWTKEKILKRLTKHTLFWIISFLIANTFLSYIIGARELFKIQQDPLGQHVGGLITIVIFTSVFYGVFTWLREQVCTTICPYGRLQGVLLDANSMVVAYDEVRGERRAKIHKGEDRKAAKKGDCIDCMQCIHVCPTGIDIRNGTQLECINCTACIDACDHIMEAVHQPKGLIRFVSENGIKNKTRFQWTRRVIAYTSLLIGLLIILTVLLITRRDFDSTILRQRGTTYQVTDDGFITNIYEITVLNKTHNSYKIEIKSATEGVDLKVFKSNLTLSKEGNLNSRILLKTKENMIKGSKENVIIQIYGNGKLIETIKTKLIGPII